MKFKSKDWKEVLDQLMELKTKALELVKIEDDDFAVNSIAEIKDSLDKVFNFDLSGEVLEQLKRISRRFFTERMEKNYKSLDFLSKLNKNL